MPGTRARERQRYGRLQPPQHLSDEWLHAGPLAVAAQAQVRARVQADTGSALDLPPPGAHGSGARPASWLRALGVALLVALVALAVRHPPPAAPAARERPVSACPSGNGPPGNVAHGHA